MKVLSLFSGIGAFEKALKNLAIPFELVGYCEIDKYASKSYSAIHDVPETMNLGDITKIDEKALQKDIDLITYGFPCQDISLAGKQKGLFNDDGTQTRSGLFFEALRIIEETQPKVAIAENVKNLVGKKFNAQFQVVLASLEAAGYNNYWQVLNAKDYGIPQNRERVFIVSIRKDIDTGSFKFPEPFPLEFRLKDMLEDEVDEKFYLKNIKDFFIEHSFAMEEKGNGFRFDPHIRKNANIAKTVTTRAGGRMDDNFVIDIESDTDTFKFDSTNEKINMLGLLNIKGNEQVRDEPTIQKVFDIPKEIINDNERQRRVYSPNGISATLLNRSDSPKVLVREATKKGYAEATEGDSINLEQPNSKTRRGRVGHGVAQTLTTAPQQAVVELPAAYDEQNKYVRKDGCVGTLTTDGSSPKHNNRVIEPVILEDFYKQRDERIYVETAPTIRSERTGLKVVEPAKNIKEYQMDFSYDQTGRVYSPKGISPTIMGNSHGKTSGGYNPPKIAEHLQGVRIRKLTPKECFRLMGFSDEDFAKAEAINSNTQLYKQAGNSIVVDVIAHIFTNLKSEY